MNTDLHHPFTGCGRDSCEAPNPKDQYPNNHQILNDLSSPKKPKLFGDWSSGIEYYLEFGDWNLKIRINGRHIVL